MDNSLWSISFNSFSPCETNTATKTCTIQNKNEKEKRASIKFALFKNYKHSKTPTPTRKSIATERGSQERGPVRVSPVHPWQKTNDVAVVMSLNYREYLNRHLQLDLRCFCRYFLSIYCTFDPF